MSWLRAGTRAGKRAGWKAGKRRGVMRRGVRRRRSRTVGTPRSSLEVQSLLQARGLGRTEEGPRGMGMGRRVAGRREVGSPSLGTHSSR